VLCCYCVVCYRLNILWNVISNHILGAALTYSARGYDSAVCCSKMSCDAFLSETLYEADKALEKFAAVQGGHFPNHMKFCTLKQISVSLTFPDYFGIP